MRRAGKYAIATGERLRHVRQVLGYTLKAVEDKSGGEFPAVTVGSWERASRDVSIERLTQYAQFLGVSIIVLLPGEPEGAARRWRLSVPARAAEAAVASVRSVMPVTRQQAADLLAAALKEAG
jgi:transcriptional regulator with XRE-family HTH domain